MIISTSWDKTIRTYLESSILSKCDLRNGIMKMLLLINVKASLKICTMHMNTKYYVQITRKDQASCRLAQKKLLLEYGKSI